MNYWYLVLKRIILTDTETIIINDDDDNEFPLHQNCWYYWGLILLCDIISDDIDRDGNHW